MAQAGVVWQQSPQQMAVRVKAYSQRLLQAIYVLAQEWATRIADNARAAAPWTDRTGLARRTLAGKAFRLAAGSVITVYGGAPYQIYLERRWGGKFAAIWPAIQRAFAAVMASVQALVR